MKLLKNTLRTPAENLAFDEALLEQADRGESEDEILRLWQAESTFVVVGRSSKVAVEVNQAAADLLGVPIFRRVSGGAAIAASHGCLFYAVLLDLRRRPHLRMLDQAHQFVMTTMLRAIEPLCPEIRLDGTCDLVTRNRKVSGNSLRVGRHWMLYHGTLLVNMRLELIANLLGHPPREPDYRAGRPHESFVANLAVSSVDLQQSLQTTWRAEGSPSVVPDELVEKLIEERYSRSVELPALNRMRCACYGGGCRQGDYLLNRMKSLAQASWTRWNYSTGLRSMKVRCMQEIQTLTYEVDFSQATRHLALVKLWIPVLDERVVTLAFPVWTPGSYMVREYTRNIESLAAHGLTSLDSGDLADVNLSRQGKNRWQLKPPAECQWLSVEYQVYCRENTVRTNWIERDYAFLTGASTFPFVVGRETAEIRLRLELPSHWADQATSLSRLDLPTQGNASSPNLPDGSETSEQPAISQGPPTSAEYIASCYDELVDSPVVCGTFPIREFEVGDKPHFFANVGGDQLWDLDRAVADMQKIVAEHQRFWGEVPYHSYWFLNLCTEAGGGLEHDNSTVLMCSRWAMRRRETYLSWLALVSHEFFHTWNVRRLRPHKLMQYDYEQEQFFEELWIAEGITSYFDDLCLVRTGLCTRDEYLARLTANIQAVQNAPGRLVQDLANASWDTWTKHYRPDENSPNSRISYYLKGAVLAWLLDTRLQQLPEANVSLGDVMRELWARYSTNGYHLDDFNALVEEFGNRPIRDWLEQQVRSSEELDMRPALEWYGLRFQELDAPHVEKSVAKVWIGSESTGSDGRLFVRRVFRNSPSDRAGLNVDDELISFDGYRVTPDTWPSRLEVYEPDQELELIVSRRGKILKLKIVLGHKPKHNWQLEVDPNAAANALANQRTWLNTR